MSYTLPVRARIPLKQDTMVSSCVCVVACVGLLVAIQTWIPPTCALKLATDMDAYMVDARTDLRNYEVGLEYSPAEPDAPPAPLPEFILDYANMIRNDIILLDNSVETRTRKRGNIQVKKHSNQATSNVPCDCKRTYEPGDYRGNYVNLTKTQGVALWYPPEVRNLTCDENKCTKPYRCQKIIYNVIVLKRSSSSEDRERAAQLYHAMPNELKYKWVPWEVPVVAACLCTSTYLSN